MELGETSQHQNMEHAPINYGTLEATDNVELFLNRRLSANGFDRILKCPACPMGDNGTFNYLDLLQHATSISNGLQDADQARAHGMVVSFLKRSVVTLPHVDVDMHLQAEERCRVKNSNQQLVFPWFGIVVNIDMSRGCVGSWNEEIKKRFSFFYPLSVQTFFNAFTGVGVLEFRDDIVGYYDAQDFGRSFCDSGRGKVDWENRMISGEHPGKDLYGWLADHQDYNFNSHIGDYLRKRGSLKIMSQIVNESWTNHDGRLMQDLRFKIQEKNLKLMDFSRQAFRLQTLVYQTENSRYSIEAQKCFIEERHMQDIKLVKEELQRNIELHSVQLKREQEKFDILQAEMTKIQEQYNELESHKVQKEEKFDILQAEMSKIQQQYKELESQKVRTEEIDINKEMEDTLKELMEDKEALEQTVQQLTWREREMNDVIQHASKAALKMLDGRGDGENICIKRVGELDPEPWREFCKKQFNNHEEGWYVPCASLISLWEKHLSDGTWYPFKMVQIDENKHKEVINKEDAKLMQLRQDFGEDVYMTVIRALNELQVYNASGRYPVPIVWNYELGRQATLAEIIYHLGSTKAKKKHRIDVSYQFP